MWCLFGGSKFDQTSSNETEPRWGYLTAIAMQFQIHQSEDDSVLLRMRTRRRRRKRQPQSTSHTRAENSLGVKIKLGLAVKNKLVAFTPVWFLLLIRHPGSNNFRDNTLQIIWRYGFRVIEKWFHLNCRTDIASVAYKNLKSAKVKKMGCFCSFFFFKQIFFFTTSEHSTEWITSF